MSISLLEIPPTAAIQVLAISADLAAGVVLGFIYFSSLRWTVSWFTGGGGVVRTIALMALRFIILGAALMLTSFAGPLHLLAVTLGIFIGRSIVLRSTRGAT